MQNLNGLREKINTLETERSHLMAEIENLRKAAETRANALETDVSKLREEVLILRELLVPNNEVSLGKSIKSSSTMNTYANRSSAVNSESVSESITNSTSNSENLPQDDISEETDEDSESENADTEQIYESLLKKLTGDERKVVEVLIAHGGKYAQKYIRTEAELSWLQTNRIISRLAERGVVTLQKDGGLGSVVLNNPAN